MSRTIDALAIPPTPEILSYKTQAVVDFAGGSQGMSEEAMIAEMDRLSIDAFLTIASRSHVVPTPNIPTAVIRGLMVRHPGRVFGIVGMNVFEPERSLRDIVHAVDDDGFKAIHVYPHRMRSSPNSPPYDPFYRMAMELSVPLVLQIGNSFEHLSGTVDVMKLVQRHDLDAIRTMRAWYCHPAHLDDVCSRFPDLKIVASHAGWPWTQDLIDLMVKHKNLFTDTSVYYPSVWEPELLEYIKGPGAHKVMWATNYPEVQWDQALQELHDLRFSGEIFHLLTRQNAVDIYSLGC